MKRIGQSFKLLRAVYAHRIVSALRPFAWVYGWIFAAFGFYLILQMFVLAWLSQFYPRISSGSANLILGVIATFDVALITLLFVGTKRTGTTGRKPATALTFLSLVLSVMSVIVSMSYLDQYVTPLSFFWPLFFMLCGALGMLYLLT